MRNIVEKTIPFAYDPLMIRGASEYTVLKDPCPVFDGSSWHLYCTGCLGENVWDLIHAVAPDTDGPWKMTASAITHNLMLPEVPGDTQVCAPGVIFDSAEGVIHMFMQTHCFALGGSIVHLVSSDGMHFFTTDVSLRSLPGGDHAGIYDPHPAEINGKKYLVYSGFEKVAHGDLFLAESESNTWYGPWKKRGRILSHEELSHHNQHDYFDYEWGIEGAQLLALPDGRVLLNAVCFLPEGRRGTRQRVFFAIADTVLGPYRSLGPVIDPQMIGFETGETGHAAGIICDERLELYYQARTCSGRNDEWGIGRASMKLSSIVRSADELLVKMKNAPRSEISKNTAD